MNLNELQVIFLVTENSPNFAKIIEKLSFDVSFEETAVSCIVSSLFQYLPHQHILVVTPVKAVGLSLKKNRLTVLRSFGNFNK